MGFALRGMFPSQRSASHSHHTTVPIFSFAPSAQLSKPFLAFSIGFLLKVSCDQAGRSFASVLFVVQGSNV